MTPCSRVEMYVPVIVSCCFLHQEAPRFSETSMLVLDEHFPDFFGNGTLFILVNIYGTHTFCGPSFIKYKSVQQDLLVTK